MLKSEEFIASTYSKYTLAEEIQFLKAAVSNVNMHVFVYDIPICKLYFFDSDTYPFGVLRGSEHSAQGIVSLGIIDEEAVSDFHLLFQKMQNGEKIAEAIIKTWRDTTASWNHIMLINHFDRAGNPIRAVGTIQDVSHRIEIEQLYTQEKQFRLAMLADSRRVYEINVSRDRFIRLESIQDTTDCGAWDVYTRSMADLCKTRVYREDWDVFLKIATKENLMQGFKNGITEFYCEYRIVDDVGKISWSSSTTHLLKDPVTDDIKGFIYVKNIDKQKEIEIQLHHQAERDALTGIYNRRAAERLITQIIMNADITRLYGFLLFDIDEFKYVNDNFGHVQGDFLLQQLSIDIRNVLRNEDVFARIGGDEFIVFLNSLDSKKEILDIANRICECVNQICVDEESDFRATISIGIAIYSQDGDTFAELYKNSDRALYYVKQNGKNGVSFFTPKKSKE